MTVNNDNLVYPEKEKTTAVILAVILGFWTWLYTYRIDKFKFWLCLILSVVTFGIFWFIAWIWAIIETVNRPKVFFDNFSNFHIDAKTPITIEVDNPVKNYKLNILLGEIIKRKRYVLVFSSKIFIYLKKLVMILLTCFIFFILAASIEAGIIKTYTHNNVTEKDYYTDKNIDRWRINQVGKNIQYGILFLASISTLLMIIKLKVKRPRFIEKRKISNLDLYNDSLSELKKEFPNVISDFGGMESFEKYFK